MLSKTERFHEIDLLGEWLESVQMQKSSVLGNPPISVFEEEALDCVNQGDPILKRRCDD